MARRALSYVGLVLLVVYARGVRGEPPLTRPRDPASPQRKGPSMSERRRLRESDIKPLDELAKALTHIEANVFDEQERKAARAMVPDGLARRLAAANQRSSTEWRSIENRDQWERFRDEKLTRLRKAIGLRGQLTAKPRVRIARTFQAEGCRITNLVFESQPGFWVTANFYCPAEPRETMPGLLICHSHHTPKEHPELQEMGLRWARGGCLVMVPDMLGHGERRQHPFITADDYPEPYRVGRQDYYFRYDLGMALHLAGESLMGWFVRDLISCATVLLDQPGVDPRRIVILGAVAGGGDPAAVTAALDRRIAGAVVFNFGGPQPETRYPLAADAEDAFNYAGSGSFESTRNLRLSAAEGLLPWVIVGAIAPRPFVYAHEFAWDRERDPVWRRLRRIWGFYGAEDKLTGAHGRGSVKGRPPQATHCTHIGRFHRQLLDPLLERWFGIIPREAEASEPLPREAFRCMTEELAEELKPRRVCDLLAQSVSERLARVRERRARLSQEALREELRRRWREILGPIDPPARIEAGVVRRERQAPLGAVVERIRLESESGIIVPVVLLLPQGAADQRLPVVVVVGEVGKAELLKSRARAFAELLGGGAALCLPDLRGLGETAPNGSREVWGEITAQSSTELMLGGTIVGARLRDLRAVLAWLRSRRDLDPARITLWGESPAEPNPPGTDPRVPRHVDGRPRWSEPLGGMVVMLGALYEGSVAAVRVRRGLSDFESVVQHQFVYIPHDAVVPGLLAFGDLSDLAAALAPRPLRLEGLVDWLNRTESPEAAARRYALALERYRRVGASDRLVIAEAEGH